MENKALREQNTRRQATTDAQNETILRRGNMLFSLRLEVANKFFFLLGWKRTKEEKK
jgi:hypothetical protein